MAEQSNKAGQMVENAWLRLFARGMMVVSTPLLIAGFTWIATTMIDVRSDVKIMKALQDHQITSFDDRLNAQARRIDTQDQRLERLERPFFDGRPRGGPTSP